MFIWTGRYGIYLGHPHINWERWQMCIWEGVGCNSILASQVFMNLRLYIIPCNSNFILPTELCKSLWRNWPLTNTADYWPSFAGCWVAFEKGDCWGYLMYISLCLTQGVGNFTVINDMAGWGKFQYLLVIDWDRYGTSWYNLFSRRESDMNGIQIKLSFIIISSLFFNRLSFSVSFFTVLLAFFTLPLGCNIN